MHYLAKSIFLFFSLQTFIFSNTLLDSNETKKLEEQLRQEKAYRSTLFLQLATSHQNTANIPRGEHFDMDRYIEEVDNRRDNLHPKIAKSYDISGQVLQNLNRQKDALNVFKKGLTLSYTISRDNSNISENILRHTMESLRTYSNERYRFNYAELIIQGVTDFKQPKKTLKKAEELLYLLPKSPEQEKLLLQIKKLESTSDFLLYTLILILIFLLLALLYYFKIYYSPLVRKISKNPKELLSLEPKELKKIKRNLQILLQWSDTLRLAKTKHSKVKQTLKFYKNPSIDTFSSLLGLNDYEKKDALYLLKNLNSGLNINNFFLLLTEDSLENIKEEYLNSERIFIISKTSHQNKIAEFCQNKNNNLIAPTVEELSELFLNQNPQKFLVKILAQCLSFKYLSPYQTKGAIHLQDNFFGRAEIIRDITTKESTNHFLVGARQVGKSSILKALERYYEENSNLKCHYFSLEYGDILQELSIALKIDEKSNLEEIVSSIRGRKRKLIFLIDEADFLSEHSECMLISSTFRKLSQEGNAIFIFAGFWKLYQSITMNYHSPLKNFAELIHLGQLETQASKELMLKPMKRIDIDYEDATIIEKTIKRCGNRANLIAMVCDNVLKNLKSNTITKDNIDEAFNQENIYSSINEWQGLSSSKKENRINRLIVYLTFKLENFTLSDVVDLIKKQNIEFSIEEIETSLKQLDLSYVLKKEKNSYSYQVPLLKEFLLEDTDSMEISLYSLLIELKKSKNANQ